MLRRSVYPFLFPLFPYFSFKPLFSPFKRVCMLVMVYIHPWGDRLT